MKKMQVGQLVDFCIEYNEREERKQKMKEKAESKPAKRKATAADVKAFFG